MAVSARRRRPTGLASVRRTNGSYGLPVSRFHNCVSSKDQGRVHRVQASRSAFTPRPAFRHPFPARVAPALVAMRPEPPQVPAAQLVEERAAGRAHREGPDVAVSIFCQTDLFAGVLRCSGHALDIRQDVVPALLAGRRFMLEAATMHGATKMLPSPLCTPAPIEWRSYADREQQFVAKAQCIGRASSHPRADILTGTRFATCAERTSGSSLTENVGNEPSIGRIVS